MYVDTIKAPYVVGAKFHLETSLMVQQGSTEFFSDCFEVIYFHLFQVDPSSCRKWKIWLSVQWAQKDACTHRSWVQPPILADLAIIAK